MRLFYAFKNMFFKKKSHVKNNFVGWKLFTVNLSAEQPAVGRVQTNDVAFLRRQQLLLLLGFTLLPVSGGSGKGMKECCCCG